MAAAVQKQPYMLIDLYILCFKNKTGRTPVVNKYREKWGFQDMIASVGYDRSVELIKFYFQTSSNWSPAHLFSTFDKLDDSLRKRDADRERRATLREETRLRMEEWEKTHES
jgi:hypothetical protein